MEGLQSGYKLDVILITGGLVREIYKVYVNFYRGYCFKG